MTDQLADRIAALARNTDQIIALRGVWSPWINLRDPDVTIGFSSCHRRFTRDDTGRRADEVIPSKVKRLVMTPITAMANIDRT